MHKYFSMPLDFDFVYVRQWSGPNIEGWWVSLTYVQNMYQRSTEICKYILNEITTSNLRHARVCMCLCRLFKRRIHANCYIIYAKMHENFALICFDRRCNTINNGKCRCSIIHKIKYGNNGGMLLVRCNANYIVKHSILIQFVEEKTRYMWEEAKWNAWNTCLEAKWVWIKPPQISCKRRFSDDSERRTF